MADKDYPQGQTSAGGEALVQESTDLRWEGHRLQGAHIELSLRFEDTTRTLESKGDREARAAMLWLAKEFKQLNDGLAAKLARISMINRTLVEILRKSEDGQAALMMRKAAELLVKGLANAEEEVFSLKAKAGELERQRDHYKALLARTNSELDVSRAHAQISEALGGEPADSSSSGGGAGGGDDATIRRSARKGGGGRAAAGGKGKAPARRSQRRRPGDDTEARATSGGDGDGGSVGDSPLAAAASAENNNRGGVNSRGSSSTVWRGARTAVPGGGGAAAGRGSSRKREASPLAAAAAAAAPTIGGGVAAASAAASTRPGSNKRPREALETATDARGRDRPGSVVGGDSTKDVEQEEGGRQGEGGDGVSSAAEGGIGRRQGDSVGDSGGGGADGSDGGGESGDPESDYNSDDAPSMFF